MFDNYSKSLLGIDKIYEQTKKLDVMSQFSNSLQLSEWAKPRSEATMLKAVFGNTSDMMNYLDTMPKVPDSVKTAFGSISERSMAMMQQYEGTSRATMLQTSIDQILKGTAFRSSAVNNSLTFLAGQASISMQLNKAGRMVYETNSNSRSIVSLQAEEVLRLNRYVGREQIIDEREERGTVDNMDIRAVVAESIERYVSNVENAISEIADMQEEDLSEVKFNIETAVWQDAAVGTATPLTLFVMENVLATYNKVLEIFSNSGQISEDFLRDLLHSTSPDSADFSAIKYILVQVVMTWSLTYGYEFMKDKITGKPALNSSPINARAIDDKTIFTKAHGNSRQICEIAGGTEVQLHNQKGKYIYIRFFHDTMLKEGYALNNGFKPL